MYTEHPEMVRYLACLVDSVIEVNDMKDFVTAFETDIRKAGGKTIMHWNK